MKKADLLRLLEVADDDTEILVNLGQDKNNLTDVRRVISVEHCSHLGMKEAWLGVGDFLGKRA